MSEPKTLNLDVYLSRWIVEDGNYVDFRVGEMRQFALEFWAPSPLTRTTERTMSLQQQRDHSYSVSGRLFFSLTAFGSLIVVYWPIRNRSAKLRPDAL